MEDEIMVEFEMYHEDGTRTDVTFTDNTGLSIHKLHDFCKRFALAAGYSEQTVEKAFGETVYDE